MVLISCLDASGSNFDSKVQSFSDTVRYLQWFYIFRHCFIIWAPPKIWQVKINVWNKHVTEDTKFYDTIGRSVQISSIISTQLSCSFISVFSSPSGGTKLCSFNSICRKNTMRMYLYLLLLEKGEEKQRQWPIKEKLKKDSRRQMKCQISWVVVRSHMESLLVKLYKSSDNQALLS